MHAPDAELLAALRSDLLRGDLQSLSTHLDVITYLESRLTERHDAAALAALRHEAERNREILAAAAAGVRAVLRRLGEAGAPAAIYSSDGRRVSLGVPTPAKESRA